MKRYLVHWPFALFTIAYFLVTTTFYKDFGISAEEPAYYSRGDKILEHYTSNTQEDLTETTYFTYAGFLALLNPNNNFDTYHLINLIMFFAIPTAAYALLYTKYKNNIMALTGPIFIVLTPRLLGHSAINPKDMSFTIFYFLSLTALFYLYKARGKQLNLFITKIVTLGFLFGLAQSLNLYGYSLYIIFWVFTLHSLIFKKEFRHPFKYIWKNFIEFTFIVALAHLFMVFTWPFIAQNPILNIITLFQAKFFNTGQNIQLFKGVVQNVSSATYLITQYLITTPIQTIILFYLCIAFIKKKIRDDLFFIFLTLILGFGLLFIFVPIKTLVGIREAQFLLPIICMISAMIYNEIILDTKNQNRRNAFTVFVFAMFIWTAVETARIHPYQYTYYNKAIGGLKSASVLFEQDYLHTSYKEAFHQIELDFNGELPAQVYVCEEALLTKSYESERIIQTDNAEKADYFICPSISENIEPTLIVERSGVNLSEVVKIN